MLKRHTIKPDSSSLPLTKEDAFFNHKPGNKLGGSRRLQNNGRKSLCGSSLSLKLGFLVLFVGFIFVCLGGTTKRTSKLDIERLYDNSFVKSLSASSSTLPLSQFPSLKEATENADIVALYFAASWCRHSTPTTKKLKELFPPTNDKVYIPGTASDKKVQSSIHHTTKKSLAIVYISSDETEKEMISYAAYNWRLVPFNSKERTDLKLHFRTCAKREMEKLGIEERLHEIPTLIIIDSNTQSILTTDGVNDIKNNDDPISQWEYLLTIAEDFQSDMHIIPHN